MIQRSEPKPKTQPQNTIFWGFKIQKKNFEKPKPMFF